MSEILDLDVLMPPKRMVKLNGKQINIGWIPAGAVWKIDQIKTQAAKLNLKKVEDGGAETEKAVELAFEMCAAFCEPQYPDMDIKWFKANVPVETVQKLAEEINKTLGVEMEKIKEYSKNGEAGQ